MVINLRSPLLLVIDVTNKCNLSCSYCFQSIRNVRPSELSLAQLSGILDEASDLGVFEINLCGGEPFIHKDILKIIDLVKTRFGVSIVTNGTLINEHIADYLAESDLIKNTQISFDGHTAAIHNSSRAQFDQALKGYLHLCNRAPNSDEAPSIGTVINKHNHRIIPELIDFFSANSSRFHLMNLMGSKAMACNPDEKQHFLESVVPQIKLLAERRNLTVSLLRKHNNPAFNFENVHIDCLAGYSSLIISADSNIYPCDMAPFSLGKWESNGDLMRAYERSKSLWLSRTSPWCTDFFPISA